MLLSDGQTNAHQLTQIGRMPVLAGLQLGTYSHGHVRRVPTCLSATSRSCAAVSLPNTPSTADRPPATSNDSTWGEIGGVMFG